MANTIEIFNSKFDKKKLVGENNFFHNSEEITEFNDLERKYISNVDYSRPENFARFGSAEEYYKNAIKYVDSNYPYDASTAEKLSWVNSLNEFEYHIYDNEFPRATGYANVSSSQYIKVYSYVKEPESTAKSAYDAGSRYTANTILDFDVGFTFETWLNFQDSTQNTNILSINAITSSGPSLSTINLLNLYRNASGYPNFEVTDGTNTYQFTSSIQDNEWHHYSFFIKSGSMSLSIDGQLREEVLDVNLIPSINSYIFVPLGLMILPLYQSSPLTGSFAKTSVFEIGGGGKVSIDEARFWNGKRTVEKVGRYWFTNIDGNDFSDPDNSNLMFYYKFNEGWDSQYQFLCLDYSGRENDGEIIDYLNDCRSTGSAIDLSGIVQDIERPEIVFKGLSYSTSVKDFYNNKVESGVSYDETNIHLLYNKFPGWILQQEEENSVKHLKQIIQIVSSYFDDLYNKISEVSEYKKIKLNTQDDNIYPFYDKILTSTGFDVTELFSNLDIIEKISSRNDITLFDEDIQKIKN